MKRYPSIAILCGSIAVLAGACATKGFVREQVGSTETRLTDRVDTQETKLRETSDLTHAHAQALETQETKLQEARERTETNTGAIESAGQRLEGLDTRVGETSALAGEAKKEAESAAAGVRDTESRLSERLANRNMYATLETKSIYFDFSKADLRDEGIAELDEVASALKADPNAMVELQGFADPRGADRYNYQLTRERVDAVVRYLVQRHGIPLWRIHAVGMGKVALAKGERPTRETHAKSRRVEIRFLAPQG
jgi:outer membrane protein OmpA-like peptidoglycan-associated protein